MLLLLLLLLDGVADVDVDGDVGVWKVFELVAVELCASRMSGLCGCLVDWRLRRLSIFDDDDD